MGIIADRFRAHLDRLQEIDRRHQESIEQLLQETKKLLDEQERILNDE